MATYQTSLTFPLTADISLWSPSNLIQNDPNYQVWTARCKSGFQFPRIVKTWFGRRTEWKMCNRSTSRGQLFCSDCATAEVS